MASQPGIQLLPSAKAKAKGKGQGNLESTGSQPYRVAAGAWELEGVPLPRWWPKDHRTGLPIHKLFRALSKDYNELWPVRPRPPDYPDRPLSEHEEKCRCIDVFQAIDTGSKET